MNDLEALVVPAVELSIGGESIVIRPLKVGQLPAFLRAIAPVTQVFTGAKIDWLAMFGDHGESLLEAIAIAVRKPRPWVDDLDGDDAMVLAAKIVEINADFFTRKILPKVDGLLQHLPGFETGSTPLNS